MPKAYFEPDTMAALRNVLNEARAVLVRRGEDNPAHLDWVARRILELASRGTPPWLILQEVILPMSLSEAGLSKSEIGVPPIESDP